jgi:hypothetical protein
MAGFDRAAEPRGTETPEAAPGAPCAAAPLSRAAAILALQRSCGNAATCRVLAREGYAPHELPRLQRPLDLELESSSGAGLEIRQAKLREKLERYPSYAGRVEDQWALEGIDTVLRTRHHDFERRLERMLPEIEAGLTRDDDELRVFVERVWVAPSAQPFSTHFVYAKVKVWRKLPVSSYTSPSSAAAGERISVPRGEKTVRVLEGDYRSNQLRTPEPGLISEGIGPLEYLWLPGAARSLLRAGFKLAGQKLAKRRATRGLLELFHGTEQRGLVGLGALGRGRIDVKISPGEFQDLGRGFYLATDAETAATYALHRGRQAGGSMQHVLSFEVAVEDLGRIVDIRRGGRFYRRWQKFLDEDAYEAVFGTRIPIFSTSVRSFLTGAGVEKRGVAFERFLARIGMRDADTIIAPLGDDVFTGITAGRTTTQVCIRSQRIADHLNSIIRGER